MDPDRWQQVDKLLDEALEVPPAKRTLFLDQACAGDKVLHREVTALLAAHEKAGRFTENHTSGKPPSMLAQQSIPGPVGLSGKKTMAEPAAESRIVRFGVFELDLRTAELRKQGVRIRLQEQPFQVLAMLLENPGEMVSREELQKRLWSDDTFVDFDHGLNKAINKIRDALCDSAENPRFVETVARRGYRFIAPVQSNGRLPVPDAPGSTTGISSIGVKVPVNARLQLGSHLRSHRWLCAAAVLFLVVTAVTATYLWRHRKPTAPNQPTIKSLAVLPLANLSGDPAQEYFSEGMTDAVITELGQISTLRVISRQSTMQYKDSKKSLPEIARELNVDYVIEGSVVKSGERVRITAQLLNALQDKHLWANSFEDNLRDVLALQAEVAIAVASQIQLKLSPVEQAALAESRPVNPEAYQLYLKGHYYFSKWLDPDFAKAIDLYTQAIAIDPDFAMPYAGLADAYNYWAWWGSLHPALAGPKAKSAAAKALELDETLAEAHSAQALASFIFDWEWKSSGSHFLRALELNPNSHLTRTNYMIYLTCLGRFDAAVAEARKTVELDPISQWSMLNMSWSNFFARRHNEAIRWLNKNLEMNYPDSYFNGIAYEQLGWNYSILGKHEKACANCMEAFQLVPLGKDLVVDSTCSFVVGRAGRKEEVKKSLEYWLSESRKRFIDPVYLEYFYLGLGDKDQAFRMLELGFKLRTCQMVNLKVDPFQDILRSDPRWHDLMRRMNLPD